ncbi:hypothetical protein [Shimia aestuarii]|uniref:Protease inhibitor Inh n=1 Tax=Shimia aestuarii TaxID=254406 RepID=A0A1I4QUC7_9RHOB|nr:hypothetical protein [Shimia aestuarii]SFM43306.1 hypothetical protein SAMN04488042_107120 [Shimia aestuarii]
MKTIGIALLAGVLGACMAIAQDAREAEDQTPTGKFMTATEVRPILQATKGNWIAVREYGGQDLVYFTHLISWRCGLYDVHYSINGGPVREFPLPDCPPDIAQPNAIPQDAEIYLSFGAGAVQSVRVDLLYDDLGTESVTFERAAVLMN